MDFEKIFNDSFNRVLEGKTSKQNDFFDAFYDRFLESSPLVADKFRGVDMTFQKTMLKQSLYYLLNLFSTRQIPEHLDKIAARHSRREVDIPPELYQLWLECLINAVRDFDPDFDDDVELAWRLVCSQGIAFMVFRYER